MQLEEKGKQMTDELKDAIDKVNQEASALEVEKEKKEVNDVHEENASISLSLSTPCL